jgi:hypothetical protein
MTEQPTCATCRFLVRNVCRRYPPAPMLYPTDNQHPVLYCVGDYRPVMSLDDWCGEHRDVER